LRLSFALAHFLWNETRISANQTPHNILNNKVKNSNAKNNNAQITIPNKKANKGYKSQNNRNSNQLK
jgi:hypothetical protein